ncbi:tRNA 4-thiouridine(8) synthase ThiI [Ruminococcaceae bacterium OttesenSCG-928-L11]|nr:tRNA 4-thiouridine(8) synthase ThiI [Ruminococcaceae bacterium OttesenSCG-928-L11]
MNELILLKSGEIALKGLNRSSFEDVLIRNCKRAVAGIGDFKFYKAQSTFYVEPRSDCDLNAAVEALSRVFGISALCRARIVEKDFAQIQTVAADYLRDVLEAASTFKVNAKRSDKKFPLATPEICRELGGFLLEQYPHLTVDVHNPEVTVTVEIRDFAAYIHVDQLPGAGGIPVGTGGNGALLISGGIDSPVAGYMMARRGVKITGIHFASPPYTSERAELKVHDLCRKLVPYCGHIQLYTVPFTEIQEAIKRECQEDYFTLIMRRFMMKISEIIARRQGCGALITGESIGQVASQTMAAMACTDAVTTMPVLRPVIGMDKEQIIAISRQIDTFETSIQPYEDCCTVFTPRHPRTNPKLDAVEKAESKLDIDGLIARAVEGAGFIVIQ